MKLTKGSYDFYLILATTVVLGIISAICIYAMFYFKMAQVQEMQPAIKAAYMNRMNLVISPFIIALILLLGICVPKRVMPTKWLNRFAGALIIIAVAVSIAASIQTGLLTVLAVSLALQLWVLILAVGGSAYLNFEKKGYWERLGSSLIHLGIILFIFDLFFYDRHTLHLVLFWITTLATVLGMLFSFYSESVAGFIKARTRPQINDN